MYLPNVENLLKKEVQKRLEASRTRPYVPTKRRKPAKGEGPERFDASEIQPYVPAKRRKPAKKEVLKRLQESRFRPLEEPEIT